MTIQKKSLLSSLNTTKKAIVASNSGEAKPNVAAPVSARVQPRAMAKIQPRAIAKIQPRAMAKVQPRAMSRVVGHVKATD